MICNFIMDYDITSSSANEQRHGCAIFRAANYPLDFHTLRYRPNCWAKMKWTKILTCRTFNYNYCRQGIATSRPRSLSVEQSLFLTLSHVCERAPPFEPTGRLIELTINAFIWLTGMRGARMLINIVHTKRTSMPIRVRIKIAPHCTQECSSQVMGKMKFSMKFNRNAKFRRWIDILFGFLHSMINRCLRRFQAISTTMECVIEIDSAKEYCIRSCLRSHEALSFRSTDNMDGVGSVRQSEPESKWKFDVTQLSRYAIDHGK